MKVLVTGHGGFALGMAEASRMIVGDQELIDWLPFEEGANLSDYQAQIVARVETHGEEGLMILTDFKGGTPFNVSMLLSQGHPQVAVLAGTNLAMILEVIDQAPTASSVTDLADHLVVIGRQGLLKGVMQARN
ncbi:PTS sugar transporter subunit IIA [uncultured Abiotrophia sp.]|uniref:PTS sugar transporter subunit IIA n=1 Tax=uncultured Abiotrophia sp. TaxID=316094 RepID=UPI002620AA5D|nr:PTS sugar transporter subunit IIA [uncultured Abiotrophia sp.]